MATAKRDRKKATSSSSSQSAKKTPREKGPSLHDRVVGLETRVSGIENRLGIDHEAIAAEVAGSSERGAELASLSEAPAEDEGA